MYDASVKSPVGIEYGVEFQLGNFDQCMNISTSQKVDGVNIQPKYCLVDVEMEGYSMRSVAVRNHEVSFSGIIRAMSS